MRFGPKKNPPQGGTARRRVFLADFPAYPAKQAGPESDSEGI
jgi:hypothetical protein